MQLPNRNLRGKERRKLQLSLEKLENRNLLAGDIESPWSWFQSFDDVPRIPPAELSIASDNRREMGPHDLVDSEWIVQLANDAIGRLESLASLNGTLDRQPVDFTVISGLGSTGLVLLRARGVSQEDVGAVLAANDDVGFFSINTLIEGQRLSNDPEFQAGLLTGLEQIDAADAWDESTGSVSTVVGVIDGGLDATHPDLYLNVWLNQGEIPSGIREQLTDIDGDGLITFYDLNNVLVDPTTKNLSDGGFASGPNADFVKDGNENGRIDAVDLILDVAWADGRDTDGNSFFDDLFGVNFRSGVSDPFENNLPLDELGHGTHVSGTIGAIGNNEFGAVGVNWQTSLMSLRILDNDNQADASAAIRAVNYARQMRSDLDIDDSGRVRAGANVRVLNNSWGQPGGFDLALESSITDSGEEGILFVAASGNGNILGNGVDNDQTPFYPASYESENVIGVAALSADGIGLATFSNFGNESVDIAAPGVGVRSTLPGGGFGPANGTSMATPHVSGTAALIWSAFPDATVAEVRAAILSTSDGLANGNLVMSSGGKLNAASALVFDGFAPAARLVAKEDITTAGGTSSEFTVRYSHRSGIDTSTIGNDDLIVQRQWGPADGFSPTLKPGSIVVDGESVSATYTVSAPGGNWDALDFGDYQISTIAGSVSNTNGTQFVAEREIGSFNVRVQGPSVLYVDSFGDSGQGSLRDAIRMANAAGTPQTIILDTGRYEIEIAHERDPDSTFPDPPPSLFIGSKENVTGWSDEESGDFDITGAITIVGNQSDLSIIDAGGFDRVFKVHPGGSLSLSRITVTGGLSPVDQGGGGILSAGELALQDVVVADNVALGASTSDPIRGGGVAVWDGPASIQRSWLHDNQANFGGGIFFGGFASGAITQSTISHNEGGAVHSHSRSEVTIDNSTISTNSGGRGAIFNGKQDGLVPLERNPALSADGRFLAFDSDDPNLVPGDNNGAVDVFVYDTQTFTYERVSIASDGTEANGRSGIFSQISLSDDGRFVAFESRASNLVPDDTNGRVDLFVYDRQTDTIERISISSSGLQANGDSSQPSLSADGRFVAFLSDASNLVAADTNAVRDVFVHDRQNGETRRVSVGAAGTEANAASGLFDPPSISADGAFVAFESAASNLVAGDNNDGRDIFVYELETQLTQRVNVASDGTEANRSDSNSPGLSGDGRFVTFSSKATNLVNDDSNGNEDVFVHDRLLDVTERVNLASDGSQTTSGPTSHSPTISNDGRFVSFLSSASNLVPGDLGLDQDVFVFDRQNSTIERLSLKDDGSESEAFHRAAHMSGNGQSVVFVSRGALVVGDVNDDEDIFLFDRQTGLIDAPLLERTLSAIEATQVTISATSGARFSVEGSVELQDVLLANQSLAIGNAGVTTDNVVFSNQTGAGLIGALTQDAHFPPFHPLLLGNPAIDQGSLVFAGDEDQRGELRVTPDVGAIEAVSASVSGVVFVDANEDQLRSTDEVGIPDIEILAIDSNDAVIGVFSVRETGAFDFGSLPVDQYQFEVVAPPNWRFSEPTISRIPNVQPENGRTSSPSLSGDGRIVAFESFASNLVVGDTNEETDAFVFDRVSEFVERVSVANDGSETNADGGIRSVNPSISLDGRYVAFKSAAADLVPGDAANAGFNTVDEDVFVFDRDSNFVQRLSVASDGSEADGESFSPVISGDGRFVAYSSNASNLVSGDTFGNTDVFVYDLLNDTQERVSISTTGEQGNNNSFMSSISQDGRFVAFSSFADNLVAGDTNGALDSFVFDRQHATLEIISVTSEGVLGNANSSGGTLSGDGQLVAFTSIASNLHLGDTEGTVDVFVHNRQTGINEHIGPGSLPSLSSDGRFVVFVSSADDLVANDTNNRDDVFVFDRQNDRIALVSVASNGVQQNFTVSDPIISADGRFIAFESGAANLVPDDSNDTGDVFLTGNPLIEPGVTRTLLPGEAVTDLSFGLVPDPGTISGTVFEDIVTNGAFDVGEPTRAGIVVFLDENQNGFRDESEVAEITDSQGFYRFDQLASFRDYTIAAEIPSGFEQLVPDQAEEFRWQVNLAPGGAITNRDFGIQVVSGTGQSSLSSVSGRVFEDKNDNGIFDSGVDVPRPGIVVYLDQQSFGERNPNEPAVTTDTQGNYSIQNLGASVVAVTTVLGDETIHSTPLGSDFALETFPLFDELRPFGNPQAIASGDFNGDSFPDAVVALGEANRISIRLNDGAGGFLSDEIDVDLGESGGPTALVVGQFNGDGTPLDVAVTNNFTSDVLVLLDYQVATKDFSSTTRIEVGEEPLDLVAAPIAGDASHLDLIVVNRADNTLQALMNDGNGGFTALTPVATGGLDPVSIVAGDLTGDSNIDIALAHAESVSFSSPFGDVRIFTGDGSGGFAASGQIYEVGATPIDLIAANFDNDANDRIDLAVSNFGSNSISILTGNQNGTFAQQTQTLGTASGAFDIAAGDIDNDGNVDIVASNLRDRNISIFRNRTSTAGETNFEPLEAVGLGQFGLAQRMPLLLANVDGDTSAPGGVGTIDVVTIPQNTDTLHVLTNRLVNGAHRVELTGLNEVSGLDIIVTPAVLLPQIDPIADPFPIDEDASEQSILLTGITKGRENGPELEVSATSSDVQLIDAVSVTDVNNSTAMLTYSPRANANGTATITVSVRDAGADGTFGTSDDATIARDFSVNVLPVNDPPEFALQNGFISVQENSPAQTIANFVSGISAGGGVDESSQQLADFVIETTSDLFSVGPDISPTGQLTFTPAADVSGTAVIQLRLSDDGGRENEGSDTTVTSFTIVILPSDPQAIVLEGSGNTFFLSQPNSQLDGVQLIDIRGSGDNTLMLDAGRIRDAFSGGSISVFSDAGDSVVFDDGWAFTEATIVDGSLVRRFEQTGASLNLIGPDDFTNPISEFDVNASGDVSALDALVIINELASRQFSESNTNPEGSVRDPSAIDLSSFRFYDVTRDLRITALDALRVINQLARESNFDAVNSEAPWNWFSTDHETSTSVDVLQDQALMEFRPLSAKLTGFGETFENVGDIQREAHPSPMISLENAISPESVDAAIRSGFLFTLDM